MGFRSISALSLRDYCGAARNMRVGSKAAIHEALELTLQAVNYRRPQHAHRVWHSDFGVEHAVRQDRRPSFRRFGRESLSTTTSFSATMANCSTDFVACHGRGLDSEEAGAVVRGVRITMNHADEANRMNIGPESRRAGKQPYQKPARRRERVSRPQRSPAARCRQLSPHAHTTERTPSRPAEQAGARPPLSALFLTP